MVVWPGALDAHLHADTPFARAGGAAVARRPRQRRRAFGASARERSATPDPRPGPVRTRRRGLVRCAGAVHPAAAVGRGLAGAATLLAWHRGSSSGKYDTNTRRRPGRPPTVRSIAGSPSASLGKTLYGASSGSTASWPSSAPPLRPRPSMKSSVLPTWVNVVEPRGSFELVRGQRPPALKETARLSGATKVGISVNRSRGDSLNAASHSVSPLPRRIGRYGLGCLCVRLCWSRELDRR